MNKSSHKLNYRYKCKIEDINYHIQLFLIQQTKMKIMINTTSTMSDDYIEYSNIYSLSQLQEISRYYILFESIEEAFEDISNIIQQKNFLISQNGNTLTLTIKVQINRKDKDVNFILDKTKVIDLYSQKERPNLFSNNYNNLASYNDSYKPKSKFLSQEKSKRNVDITNIKELNTLLSDFKDRISQLENSQNGLYNNNNYNNINKISKFDIGSSGGGLIKGLETIIMKINRLETENNNKDKKIEKLENKLKYYETGTTNDFLNTNKGSNFQSYNKNNIIQNSQQQQLRTQKQSNLSYINENDNENGSVNENPIIQKNQRYLYPSKSENKYNKITTDNDFYINSKNNKNNNKKNNSFNNNRYINENKNEKYRSTPRRIVDDRDKDSRKYYTKYKNYLNNSSLYNDDNSASFSNYNNTNMSNMSLSKFSNLKDKKYTYLLLCKDKYGIPTVSREEDLKKYVNSRIFFTKRELRLLKNKLSGGDKKTHVFFDLLYRASIDGDYDDIVKGNAEDKLQTLTLFYTYEGARFGVYIHKKKVKTFFRVEAYEEIPGTSFIVSLNNLLFFDVMDKKISKNDFNNLLSFGNTYYLNKNGSNYLIYTPNNRFLKGRYLLGNKPSVYMDFDSELLIGNKMDYHLKDVEIFNVVFEKE